MPDRSGEKPQPWETSSVGGGDDFLGPHGADGLSSEPDGESDAMSVDSAEECLDAAVRGGGRKKPRTLWVDCLDKA